MRRDLLGQGLARILLQHHRVLQLAKRSLDQALVALAQLGLRNRGLGRRDAAEILLRMQNLLRGHRRFEKHLGETRLPGVLVHGVLELHALRVG